MSQVLPQGKLPRALQAVGWDAESFKQLGRTQRCSGAAGVSNRSDG
jgi:hypothetical protein